RAPSERIDRFLTQAPDRHILAKLHDPISPENQPPAEFAHCRLPIGWGEPYAAIKEIRVDLLERRLTSRRVIEAGIRRRQRLNAGEIDIEPVMPCGIDEDPAHFHAMSVVSRG